MRILLTIAILFLIGCRKDSIDINLGISSGSYLILIEKSGDISDSTLLIYSGGKGDFGRYVLDVDAKTGEIKQ